MLFIIQYEKQQKKNKRVMDIPSNSKLQQQIQSHVQFIYSKT